MEVQLYAFLISVAEGEQWVSFNPAAKRQYAEGGKLIVLRTY